MASTAPCEDFGSKSVYDAHAADYSADKLKPWRVFVERTTILDMAKPYLATGKAKVLDLACGEGVYSRVLKDAGAAHVVGIDLSPGMVEKARELSRAYPDIEFRVGDASVVESIALPGERGTYDVVLASYLFNYAPNRAVLAAMSNTVAAMLKPGGCLVVVNSNPGAPPRPLEFFTKYGFHREVLPSPGNPDTVKFHMLDDRDGSDIMVVTNYSLPMDMHAELFEAAGLSNLTIHPPTVNTPPGLDKSHFDDWVEGAPVHFFTAVKSEEVKAPALTPASTAASLIATTIAAIASNLPATVGVGPVSGCGAGGAMSVGGEGDRVAVAMTQ